MTGVLRIGTREYQLAYVTSPIQQVWKVVTSSAIPWIAEHSCLSILTGKKDLLFHQQIAGKLLQPTELAVEGLYLSLPSLSLYYQQEQYIYDEEQTLSTAIYNPFTVIGGGKGLTLFFRYDGEELVPDKLHLVM